MDLVVVSNNGNSSMKRNLAVPEIIATTRLQRQSQLDQKSQPARVKKLD